MAIDFPALAAEISSDPSTISYAPHVTSGSDATIARFLNKTRAEIQISRGVVPAHEVFEQILPAEWAGLTTVERERIQLVLGMGDVDLRGANTRDMFKAAFGAGTITRSNFASFQTRDGSRAEELFGAGTVVGHLDVARSLGRF